MSQIKKQQCPSCGGNLFDDSEKQMYRCISCGSSYDYDYFREEKLHGMGETYLSRGESKAAIDAYRLILQNNPHDFAALRGLMLAAAYLKDMNGLAGLGAAKHFSYDSKLVSEVIDSTSEEDREYFTEFGRIYTDKKQLVDYKKEIDSLQKELNRVETTTRLTEDARYDYYFENKNGSRMHPKVMFVLIWCFMGFYLMGSFMFAQMMSYGDIWSLIPAFAIMGAVVLFVGFFINFSKVYPKIKGLKEEENYIVELNNESGRIGEQIRKVEAEADRLAGEISRSIHDFVKKDRQIMAGSVKEQVSDFGKIRKHQCPSCGGSLRIDSDKQMYHCTFCGSTYDYEYFREDRIHEAGETYLSRGEFMATTEAYEFMLKKDPHDFLALRGLMLAAAHLTSVSELDQLNKEEKFSYDPDMARQATENASEEDKEYFKEFGRVYADKQRLNDCLEEIESLREKKRKNSSLITRKNVERASYFVKGELAASGNLRTAYIVIWIVNAFFLLMLILSVIGLVKDYAADPASLGGSLEMVLFLAAVNAALLIYNHVANFSKLIKVNKIEKDISALYVEAGKIDEQIRDLENESDDLLSDIKRSIHDFVRKDRLVMREKKMS